MKHTDETKRKRPAVSDSGPLDAEGHANIDRLSQAQGKLLLRKLRGGKEAAFGAGQPGHGSFNGN
ncbi:MAG: hypothetical protein ACR2FY_04130 [Pirellulaceae bacterium]